MESHAAARQSVWAPEWRGLTIGLLVTVTLVASEALAVATVFPLVARDLHGLALYGWVISAFFLGTLVGLVVGGEEVDRRGPATPFAAALIVFAAGLLIAGLAPAMWVVVAARGLQGLGAAGLVPIALTVSGDLFSLEERARVQGLFSGVWGTASLIGPLLGAWMTMSFGWRSIFTINVPLGLVAFILVATQMIESRAKRADPLDLAGAVSLAVGVTTLLFAVLHSPGDRGLGLPERLGLFVMSAGSLALFARLQLRRVHPLIPPRLLARLQTAAPYMGGVLLGTTIFGVDTFVPLFVQGARGGTAGAAGAVVTPLVFFWATSATLAARLIVRFGFRRTARWGAILILAGLSALVAAAYLNASVPWISAACALVGAGLGPSSMSQVLGIQDAVEERERGVATSLVPFFRAIGGSIGVGALGGLLAVGLDRHLGPAAETAGRFLAEGHAAAGLPVAPDVFRVAIEQSLIPVFAILAALAVVNLVVTGRFPEHAAADAKTLRRSVPLSVD